MSIVKPFRAVRPCDNERARLIAALPYDVYSREEARKAVEGKPLSFLNIDRPETFFPEEQYMYAPEVYSRAREEYEKKKAEGSFIQEQLPAYYLYELTMDGRSQTGIVGVTAVSDYEDGSCKKHENTVAEKETDRIHHVAALSAQTGPIFLAFPENDRLAGFVTCAKAEQPLFDFVTQEGIGQRVWKIDDPGQTAFIERCFQDIPNTYIADGHHRAASAVKVSQSRRTTASVQQNASLLQQNASLLQQNASLLQQNASLQQQDASVPQQNAPLQQDTRLPESEYFLSVLFPDNELKILDYNRTVLDLNGMSPEKFLERLEKESPYSLKKLKVSRQKEEAEGFPSLRPTAKNQVGMYLDGAFYLLELKKEYADQVKNDPVKRLDVSVLQDTVLDPLLGIQDPRTDRRVRFIGGIRGLSPLVQTVDQAKAKGRNAVSFAMYPTSMEELFSVADAGLLMPPKSTWFEPKLRSGLFIHEI